MVMRDKKLLIIGATGLLGKPVAHHILAKGYNVKIMCRDSARAQNILGPGFEYCEGDVLKPDQLKLAIDGCTGVYLNLKSGDNFDFENSTEIKGLTNTLDLVPQSTLEWLGCISGAGDLAQHAHLPPLKIKYEVERLIQSSPIPYTLFKPTHFMESLRLFVRDGKAAIPGHQSNTYHYLAASDYAELVLDSWINGLHKNIKVTILGPQSFSMKEALSIYAKFCLEHKKVGSIPLPLLRVIATITNNQPLKTATTLFRTFQQIPEDFDEESILVQPKNAVTLEQWCQNEQN